MERGRFHQNRFPIPKRLITAEKSLETKYLPSGLDPVSPLLHLSPQFSVDKDIIMDFQ